MQTFLIVAGCVWFLIALIFVGALCFAARRVMPGLENEVESSEARMNSQVVAKSPSAAQAAPPRDEEFPFIDSVPHQAPS